MIGIYVQNLPIQFNPSFVIHVISAIQLHLSMYIIIY